MNKPCFHHNELWDISKPIYVGPISQKHNIVNLRHVIILSINPIQGF
jgi:hypothetical protein